jgi:hypothetical protein
MILLDAKVNGKPAALLLDTGARMRLSTRQSSTLPLLHDDNQLALMGIGRQREKAKAVIHLNADFLIGLLRIVGFQRCALRAALAALDADSSATPPKESKNDKAGDRAD